MYIIELLSRLTMKAFILSRSKSLFLAAFAVVIFAGLATYAYAQVNPRGTASVAPTGRVLQAATCDLNNGITVSYAPASPKIGEEITFTATLKPECQTGVQKVRFTLGLYKGAYASGKKEFSIGDGFDFTVSKKLLVTSEFFTPGSNTIGATISYCPNVACERILIAIGSAEVTVAAADATGDAKLNGVEQSTYVESENTVKKFSFSYVKGGSTFDATSVQYNCGGTGAVQETAAINATVTCRYGRTAGTYKLTAQAVDAGGKAIPGATWETTVTITGSEVNAPPIDSGSCGILDGPLCVINFVISTVVFVFNSVVKFVLLNFLGPFIETLVSIRTYKDDFAQVIYSAWQVLRNLGNIFFILSIVAIGVATVFRISGYAVKDLLVKLIVGALLINFSLTIAQAVLGIADTATNQFLGPNTGALKAIVNPLVSTDIWANIANRGGDLSSSIQAIVSFWLAFAAFIAFLGVAFLLFVRIIMLWVLLMLSPLPYVAMVLPATKSMSKKWWSKFIQWAFNAPIIAFMLNLTATITTANQDIIQKISTVQTNSSSAAGLMFAVAGQAIPIGFMFMTVKAGAAVGKGAAGFVDKAISKGAKAAFVPAALTGAAALSATKFAGGAAKSGVGAGLAFANYKKQAYGLKLADSGTTGGKIAAAALSPLAAGKAIKASFAARAADRKKTGEYTQDAIASSLSTSPLKSVFGHKSLIDKVEQRKAKEEKERMEQISYSEKANTNATDEAIKKGEGKEVAARIKLAVQEGDFGEILKKNLLTNDLEGKVKLIDKLVRDKVITEDTATRLSAEIDSAAKKKGDLHYVGGTRVDNDKLVRITEADLTTPGDGNTEFKKAQENYTKKLKDLGAGGRARDTSFGMIVTEDPTVAGADVLRYKPEQIVQIANMSDADYNASDSVNDKRKRQEKEFLFDPTHGDDRRKKAVDDLSAVLIADAEKQGITLDATTAKTQAQEKFNKYLRKYLQTTTSGQDLNKKTKDLFTTMSRENASFGTAIKGIQSADRRQLQDYVDNLGTSPEEYTYDLRPDIAGVIDPARLATAKNELRDTVAKAVSERFVPKSYGITSTVNDTQVKAIRDAIAEAVKTVTTIHSGLSLKDTAVVQPSLLADIDARLTALGATSGLTPAEIHAIADKASKI